MSDKKTINYWTEIDGGFRGSMLLRLGALFFAAGGLTDLGAKILTTENGPSDDITGGAWLMYIVGLWLLAAGFFWVGSHPILTRFGLVVGVFHAIQGTQVLLLLFTHTSIPIPPISLTIGRLLATFIFALIETEWLDSRTRKILAGASGLLLLKASSRILGYLPEMAHPLEPLLDTVMLLILAAALFHLATAIRHQEDDWARSIYDTGHGGFADFNNPEHSWNKPISEVDNKRHSTRS